VPSTSESAHAGVWLLCQLAAFPVARTGPGEHAHRPGCLPGVSLAGNTHFHPGGDAQRKLRGYGSDHRDRGHGNALARRHCRANANANAHTFGHADHAVPHSSANRATAANRHPDSCRKRRQQGNDSDARRFYSHLPL
jgi:hypothetical protein